MGCVAYSALLTGIGDSVHGYETLRNLPRHLDRRLVAVLGTGEFMDSLLSEGMAEVDLRTIPVAGAFSRLSFELRSYRELRRLEDIDAVYLRFRSFALLPYLFARRRRIPLVVEVNGIPALERERSLRNGLLLRLTRPIDKRLLRNSHVIVVDRAMLDQIRSHYGIDIAGTHVPNGIDTEAFKPMEVSAVRDGLGLPGGRIVMFVGALERWQGIENLIEAFRKVRQGDMHLVIVGDGSLRNEVEGTAPEGVTFTGRVPYDLVPSYINSADICVVPIPAERPNFPMKAREALACGVPLLVTENESARELREVAPSFLMRDNSPESIADGIERIFSDPGSHEAALRCREMIVKGYSWDSAMEKVAGVLNRSRSA